MFCTKCGTQLGDDAQFCVKCGTPTGAAAQGNADTSSTTSDADVQKPAQATPETIISSNPNEGKKSGTTGKGIGWEYTGEMMDGKRHGKGKCVYKNGDVYEGEYDNGYLKGRGKYIRANGKVYEGFFTQSGSLFRAENSNGLQELGLADSE